MRTSLTHRFSRTLFLLILANTAILLFVVDLFVDDVEDTILSLELQADADFFIAQIANNEYMDVKTARLESYFIPEGSSSSDLPGYLKKRSVPFSREIVSNGKTYLIFSKRVSGNNNGVLYLAQDISIMESRELLVRIALFGVAGLLFLVGFSFVVHC